MEQLNINQKSYQEKKEILKSVFSEYQKANQQLQELPYQYHSPLIIKETTPRYGSYEHQLLGNLSKMYYYQDFIDFIDEKINRLNETERMIIEKDFLKPTHKLWWEVYFSSATYYRHKKRAVEDLIRLLFS